MIIIDPVRASSLRDKLDIYDVSSVCYRSLDDMQRGEFVQNAGISMKVAATSKRVLIGWLKHREDAVGNSVFERDDEKNYALYSDDVDEETLIFTNPKNKSYTVYCMRAIETIDAVVAEDCFLEQIPDSVSKGG